MSPARSRQIEASLGSEDLQYMFMARLSEVSFGCQSHGRKVIETVMRKVGWD